MSVIYFFLLSIYLINIIHLHLHTLFAPELLPESFLHQGLLSVLRLVAVVVEALLRGLQDHSYTSHRISNLSSTSASPDKRLAALMTWPHLIHLLLTRYRLKFSVLMTAASVVSVVLSQG